MIALVLAATLLSPTLDAAGLVGLWESAATSSGGIGHALEFRADGTFVEATTVIVDMYYRVIGDRLVVGEQLPGADADAGKASQIKIEGDVFIQTGPDGSVVRRERLGRAEEGKPAIVGAWRYRHYTKAIAFERYTDGGRLFFRLPMASAIGRYLLKANELVLTQPNRPDSKKLTIEIQGDEIHLSGGDGPAKTYRRVAVGPWYDREHIEKRR